MVRLSFFHTGSSDTDNYQGDYYFIMAGNELISQGLASCTTAAGVVADARVLANETHSAIAGEDEKQNLDGAALGLDQSRSLAMICGCLVSAIVMKLF